jgi:hypothetical protein
MGHVLDASFEKQIFFCGIGQTSPPPKAISNICHSRTATILGWDTTKTLDFRNFDRAAFMVTSASARGYIFAYPSQYALAA